MVSAGLAWLDEQGAEIVDLNATPQAARLYMSLGFAEPPSRSLRKVRPKDTMADAPPVGRDGGNGLDRT